VVAVAAVAVVVVGILPGLLAMFPQGATLP
jgi:hypothetical protein